MAKEIKLACTSGNILAKIGDRFTDHNGEWEIVRFGEDRTYSPSSLGGTPIVVIKPIGAMPSWFKPYENDDGTVDFCGDSVAASLLDNRDGKRRDARGSLLNSPQPSHKGNADE
jgi:hypothetical protein